MIVSLFGSHGVGKTSTITKIQEICHDWRFMSESTREVMPSLGYGNPYDFVDLYGIAFYEAIIISHWSSLKAMDEFQKCDKILLLDRSPIDNLAYYFLHRKDHELIYEDVLVKLAKIYLEHIQEFIYFPSGVFDFVPDSMQRKDTQAELDRIIVKLLNDFSVSYYKVCKLSIDDRAKEIIGYITHKINS